MMMMMMLCYYYLTVEVHWNKNLTLFVSSSFVQFIQMVNDDEVWKFVRNLWTKNLAIFVTIPREQMQLSLSLCLFSLSLFLFKLPPPYPLESIEVKCTASHGKKWHSQLSLSCKFASCRLSLSLCLKLKKLTCTYVVPIFRLQLMLSFLFFFFLVFTASISVQSAMPFVSLSLSLSLSLSHDEDTRNSLNNNLQYITSLLSHPAPYIEENWSDLVNFKTIKYTHRDTNWNLLSHSLSHPPNFWWKRVNFEKNTQTSHLLPSSSSSLRDPCED